MVENVFLWALGPHLPGMCENGPLDQVPALIALPHWAQPQQYLRGTEGTVDRHTGTTGVNQDRPGQSRVWPLHDLAAPTSLTSPACTLVPSLCAAATHGASRFSLQGLSPSRALCCGCPMTWPGSLVFFAAFGSCISSCKKPPCVRHAMLSLTFTRALPAH